MLDSQQQGLFDRVFFEVAQRQASDVFLSVGNPPMMSLDGVMQNAGNESLLTPELLQAFATHALSQNEYERLSSQKNITVAYTHGNSIRMRLAFYYQEGNLSAVGRFIPSQIPRFSELGLPDVLQDVVSAQDGLVVIAGPQHSGKTTTIAALVQSMNEQLARHMITIEDPIEFLFVDQQSVIDQRQVGRDVLTCAEGLQAIRDQQADVVVVDRFDPKDAQLVLSLAASRLVIVGLESRSAVEAIQQIVNAQENEKVSNIRQEISERLRMISAQILLPKVGGGRVAAVEILKPSQAVVNTIRDGNLGQLENIIRMSRAEGMVSLENAVAELVKEGRVNPDETKNLPLTSL